MKSCAADRIIRLNGTAIEERRGKLKEIFADSRLLSCIKARLKNTDGRQTRKMRQEEGAQHFLHFHKIRQNFGMHCPD